MDMSKLSTADLEAISVGDMSKVSTEGLQYLATGQLPQAPTGLKAGLYGAAVGLGGLPLGMAHAGAKLLGIEDTGVQSARESLKEWGKQHGTESFAGRVGETIGGLAPFALAAPFTGGMSLAAELGLNAVTMGAPGAVDAYEEAKKAGAGDAEAYGKAALAAGMGTVAPKIVSGGSQAVGKALKVGESVLPQAALAAGEGAVFTGAHQVANKAIEQAAGRDTGTPWLSPEDIASSSLGFGVVRGAHKMLEPKKPAAVKPPPEETPPTVDTTTPEYKLDLADRHDAAQAKYEELKQQVAALAKPTTELEKAQKADAIKAVQEYKTEVLRPLVEEYKPYVAEVAQLRAQQAQGGEKAPEAPAATTDLFGNPVAPTPEVAAPEAPVDYHRQAMLLQQHVDALQDQVAHAADPQQIVALAKQHADAEKALAEAKENAGKQPKPLDMQLADAAKQLAKAQEEGDVAKAGKLAQTVLTLKEQGAQENVIPLEKFKPTVTIPDQSLRALRLQTAPEAKAANEAAQTRAAAMEGEEGEQAIIQQAQANKAAADAAAQEAQAAADRKRVAEQEKATAQEISDIEDIFRTPAYTPLTGDEGSLEGWAAKRVRGGEYQVPGETRQASMLPALYGEGQATDLYLPKEPTAESLQRQIDTLPKDILPEQQRLVARLQDNLSLFAGSPERARMASEWLHGLRTGARSRPVADEMQADVGRSRDIESALHPIEEATQRTALEAGQAEFPEMPEKLQTVFNTPEEFMQHQASDSLHELRTAMGETVPTIQRAYKQLEPLERRIEQLAANAKAENDKYEAMKARTDAGEINRLPLALASPEMEQLHARAQERLDAVLQQHEAELAPFRKEVQRIQQKVVSQMRYVLGLSERAVRNAHQIRRSSEDIRDSLGHIHRAQKFADQLAAAFESSARPYMEKTANKANWDAMREMKSLYGKAIEDAHAIVFDTLQKHIATTPDMQRKFDLFRNNEKRLHSAIKKETAELLSLQERLQKATHTLEQNPDFQRIRKNQKRRISYQQAVAERDVTAGMVETSKKASAEEADKLRGLEARTPRDRQAEEAALNKAAGEKGKAERALTVAQQEHERAIADILETQNKRARKAPPVEKTQSEKEQQANAERIENQARMERLEKLHGERFIGTKREDVAQAMFDAHTKVENLRNAAGELEASLPRLADKYGIDSERYEDARNRLTAVNGQLTNAVKELHNASVKMDEFAAQRQLHMAPMAKRLFDAHALIKKLDTDAKGGARDPNATQEQRDKRLNQLANARKEIAKVQPKFDRLAGVKRTSVGTEAVREAVTPQTEDARIAAALEKAQDALEKAQHEGNKRLVEYYENQIQLLVEGKLPERKIGQLVKPVVHAGNVRTGTAESKAGEMKTGVRGTEQGGAKRGVTATQAIREANKVAEGYDTVTTPEEAKARSEESLTAARNALVRRMQEHNKLLETRPAKMTEKEWAEAKVASKKSLEIAREHVLQLQREPAQKPTAPEAAGINQKEEAAKDAAAAAEARGKIGEKYSSERLINEVNKGAVPAKDDPTILVKNGVGIDAKVVDENTVYLSLIRNEGTRNEGKASARLDAFLRAADKNGVEVLLTPEAVKPGKTGLTSKQLEQWYASRGFKPTDAGMFRPPKTAGKSRKLTAAEKEAIQAEMDAEYTAEISKEDARAASNPDQDRATTDLTDTGREAAEDGRILDLLDDVAENGATPERRAQAEALKKLVMRSKLEVVDNLMHEGKRVAGLYAPEKNTIYLDREGMSQEDFLHEAYHAATDRVLLADKDTLTPTQRAARAELERMHKSLSENPNFKDLHATKNVREFVAEVKTNDALRAKMQEFGKPTKLWSRFKDAIKRLLGIGPKDMSPTAADRLIEDILQPSRVIEKAAETPSLFRKKESGLPTELTEFSKYVHDERTALDKAKEMKDSAGLAFRQAVADMRASLREALTYGNKERGSALDTLVSQRDSNINLTQNVAEFGSLALTKDANGNAVVTAGNSDSLKDVFEQAKNLPGSDSKEKLNLYQRYRIARRAEQVGWDKMNFDDPAGAQAAGRKLLNAVKADSKLKAAFDAVDKPYDSLNKGLVKFLEQTHALPKEVLDKMMADKDYVPYYRVNGDTVEALLPDGKFRSVGDIRTQPFLKELVGGEQKFMNFTDSVMRNISLLSSIGMDNLTSKEIAYHLQDVAKGTGKMVIQRGKGPASQDIVRFRQKSDPNVKGDDGWRHIKIDTEGTVLAGIPTTLLAQSMAGSYNALSGLEKAGAWAGAYLRSGITRNPLYIVRQLVKDPMHASVTGNVQATPIAAVIKSMRNFADIVSGNSPEADILRKHGVTHSNIFSGTAADHAKVARMLAGDQQGWWDRVKGAMDKYASAADAATRVQVYKDIIAKGGTESEATHAARELMNFNRRGSAQSIQFLGHVIPFFNSQIQGLDLLYRSASGKMPAQERMETKQKFFNRAMAMSAMAFTYAALMEDDPEWAGQSLYQKMANIAIPNIFTANGESLKLPAPFESGMLFYSLPVAIMQAMKNDFSKEDYKTVAGILTNQLPGGAAIPVPSAVKGALEVMTNYNMTTGLPVESAAMKRLDPAERYNERTTELAKAFGQMLSSAGIPLSPVQIEHLSNAYMGTLPTAVAGLVDTLFEDGAVEKPTKHIGEYPFLSQLFMPAIGSDASSHAYEKASNAEMVRNTFKHYLDMGQAAEAKQYRESHKTELAAAAAAGAYVKQMGMLKKDIEHIRNLPKGSLSAEEKQARIDNLKKAQQARANQFLQVYRRIEQNVGQSGA